MINNMMANNMNNKIINNLNNNMKINNINNMTINQNTSDNNNNLNNNIINILGLKKENKSKMACDIIFGPINNSSSQKSIENNNNQKKFKLNIIYYDENLKSSKENNSYCSDFKMNTLGTFYGIHHYNLFLYICKRLYFDSKIFTLICSGSAADKIFSYCSNLDKINRFYIFCFQKEKYIYLLQKYPKLKNVYNNYNDLKSELLSLNDLKINQIKSSNLIYINDYNRIYIKLHYEIIRKYSLYKLLKSNNYNQSKFLELIKDKYAYYLEIAKQLVYQDEKDMIDFFKKNTNENESTLKNVFNETYKNIYLIIL